MASTSFLVRRGRIWHYNRAYPKELWGLPGKRSPFRLSLRTESLEEAQRGRPEAERRYWEAVDRARLALSRQQSAPLLNDDLIDAIVSRWLCDQLRRDEDWLSLNKTPAEVQHAIEGAEYGLGSLREELALNELAEARRVAQAVAAEEGIAIDPADPSLDRLSRLLQRARIAREEVHSARLRGDYGFRPADPRFASLMGAPIPPLPQAAQTPRAALSGRTITDLEAAYRRDKVQALSQSTRAAYEPVFRAIREVLGATTRLADLTREDGRRLFEAVQAIPAGFARRRDMKNLSVPRAIEEGRRRGLPTLSAKTITASYMGFISSIFGWAANEGWMTSNIVKGLSVRDPVAPADRRDPFTPAQLDTIFAAAPWSPWPSDPRQQDIRLWGPLLALFLGMRRAEIAQLRVTDVEEREGVPVLQVRRQVKTAAGRRTLPIHPELVRLGFLVFVAEQRRAGNEMLFADEAPNSRGQWGDALGDWFSRRLRQLGVAGKKLGMHSFRHNFEDRLREAGLHGLPIGKALAGRSAGGDVSAAYGAGFSTGALAAAISRIIYPGLVIGPLQATD